jgi:hypothetical protein
MRSSSSSNSSSSSSSSREDHVTLACHIQIAACECVAAAVTGSMWQPCYVTVLPHIMLPRCAAQSAEVPQIHTTVSLTKTCSAVLPSVSKLLGFGRLASSSVSSDGSSPGSSSYLLRNQLHSQGKSTTFVAESMGGLSRQCTTALLKLKP